MCLNFMTWMIVVVIFMLSVNSLFCAIKLWKMSNRYMLLECEHAKLSSFVSNMAGRLGEIESVLNNVD